MIDVAWLGHASVDVTVGGRRFVTDPVLRDRIAHLRRRLGHAELREGPIDAVLISHLHHDHLDLPSLRRLPRGTPLVVPRGSGRLVHRITGADVTEVAPGDELRLGDVLVTAVEADHRPNRTLSRVTGHALGFVITAPGDEIGDPDTVVYFAGDTDLHPMMADLPAPDLALLPIWGWGRTIGPGHLDPDRAGQAASLLRARAVLPVHWGTFSPVGTGGQRAAWLRTPADTFRDAIARHAPEVDLLVVPPDSARHVLGGPAAR